MFKRFLLATKLSSDLQAAVFATGAESPMEVLVDVERELSKQKIVGSVLFDLLLSNGNKANRYFVAEFDGKHFHRDGFTSVSQQYESLSNLSALFLQKHVSEVDPSLLTRAMRFALKKGIPF